jgi:hypothetical protein
MVGVPSYPGVVTNSRYKPRARYILQPRPRRGQTRDRWPRIPGSACVEERETQHSALAVCLLADAPGHSVECASTRISRAICCTLPFPTPISRATLRMPSPAASPYSGLSS